MLTQRQNRHRQVPERYGLVSNSTSASLSHTTASTRRKQAPPRQDIRDRFEAQIQEAAVRAAFRRKGKVNKAPNQSTTRNAGSTAMFAAALGEIGVDTLLQDTSMVWQHGSVEDVRHMPIPAAVENEGVRICSAKAARLKTLEAFISKQEPSLDIGVIPRVDGVVDRNFLAEYDPIRFEYRSLVLELIIDTANAERHEDDPHALGFTMVKTSPLNWNGKIIEPLDSFTIYDQGNVSNQSFQIMSDSNVPAITLYLPSVLAVEHLAQTSGPHFSALRGEVALQMRLNDKLSYQGLRFDGVDASLFLAHVDRLQDNLARHKTHFGFAGYYLPMQRNGFVADMVQLLNNHTDHRKVYNKSIKTAVWKPRRGITQC